MPQRCLPITSERPHGSLQNYVPLFGSPYDKIQYTGFDLRAPDYFEEIDVIFDGLFTWPSFIV